MREEVKEIEELSTCLKQTKVGPIPFWTDMLLEDQEKHAGLYPPVPPEEQLEQFAQHDTAMATQTHISYAGVQPQFVQGASGQASSSSSGRVSPIGPAQAGGDLVQIGGGAGALPPLGGPPRGGGPPPAGLPGGGGPLLAGPPGGPLPAEPPGGATLAAQPHAGVQGGQLMGEHPEFFTGNVTMTEKFIHQFNIYQ
jgi:hypothetical protein